jgi:hypothetical protein
MGKSNENEMKTNLITGERFNGLRNGASHTFSSRLRSVIRYPLCVLVSAVAWAFAFNTALLFAIKVHAPDGRIILSRGGCVLFYSWIYPQSGINCDWSCVILLIFLSAAIATNNRLALPKGVKMKRLTSLLAAVLLLLPAISTAFAGQPADYNKPTVAVGTLVYLSNPRRASDDPGSPAAPPGS